MIKDTIKKYTGVIAVQDYISDVENAEKFGTGLSDEVTQPSETDVDKYLDNLDVEKGAYKGRTFKEASKNVNIFTSKKQGCCECVIFSYENVLQKFWRNRGYVPREYIIDTTINYSLYNVKENAMVGCSPSYVYREFYENGAVPKITEKKGTKFKEWYIGRSTDFAKLSSNLRINYFAKKVSSHTGFFSFDKFERELEKARNEFGEKNVMFRISKNSAVGVKWYNVDVPYIDKTRKFRYTSGGHSMAGDGEIGVYEMEGEKAVYIYESYGNVRFHHLKKSIFDLVVKSWEIYVDFDSYQLSKGTLNKKVKKPKLEYTGIIRRCVSKAKCNNDYSRVVAIQKKLGIKADGIFGYHTELAVKQFQKKNKLKVDGIVGLHTWNKLFS